MEGPRVIPIQEDQHLLTVLRYYPGDEDPHEPDTGPTRQRGFFWYVTFFAARVIFVFNNKWQMTGTFTDPVPLPAGYAAFNAQNLGVNGTQTILVTYANQSTTGGIVDEFTTNGTFIKTLIDDTAGVNLSAPWGLAIAPSSWGAFGGDLIVANNNANSDGVTGINAYKSKNRRRPMAA